MPIKPSLLNMISTCPHGLDQNKWSTNITFGKGAPTCGPSPMVKKAVLLDLSGKSSYKCISNTGRNLVKFCEFDKSAVYISRKKKTYEEICHKTADLTTSNSLARAKEIRKK